MDTNKGLIISSSSSSTLPTPPPRPYRVGSKPLPEELRKKIEDSHGVDWYGYGVVPYCLYADLIEPIDCIDPDDPKSWAHLDDPSNLIRGNSIKKYLFSPNQRPLVQGDKIVGRPIFELYRIEIIKLDRQRDFSSIFMMGTNTDYQPIIIYNLPPESESEEILVLNQPLPLKNIFRPPSALNGVTIALSNPANGGWALWYNPPDDMENMKYGKRGEYVTDDLTESEAFISCELIKSAAIAELVFTLLDDKQRPITIFSGSITATTNGDPSTERIIRQFSSSQPSVLLQSNEMVPVNRSVFGVSLDSCLNLVTNFKYFVGKDGPYNMEGCLIFPVPKKTESVEKCITSPDGITKLRVKVSWWDCMV